VRLARWSAAHPVLAIGVWVLLVGVCFTAGNLTGTTKQTSADQHIGDASTAAALLRSAGLGDPDTENVLIAARSGPLDNTTAPAAANAITDAMKGLPVVAVVNPPLPAPDGRALLVRITLTGNPETADHGRVRPLLDATSAVQGRFPALRIEEAGTASIALAMDDTLGADFHRAELFSIPVTLVILLIAFGALLAAGVPVLLALSSVAAAIGLAAAISRFVPVTGAANSMVLLIGMAVGVDYSLFYLRRERAERANGASKADAMELAAATSGHAVLVSGTAVIVAMAGLFLAKDAVFSSLAIASIAVVALAVLGSLTVLPALVAALGRRIDRPRVPLVWRLTARSRNQRGGGGRFWPMLLRPALRHPAATLLVSVVALLLLASPALGMRLKLPATDEVPRTLAVMGVYDRITSAFPSAGTAHDVVIVAPLARQAQVHAALDDLANRTAHNPLFEPGRSAVRTSKTGTVVDATVVTPYPAGTTGARDSLAALRDRLLPATVGAVPDTVFVVGGAVAIDVDYAAHTAHQLPLVMGFVLALTFVMMAFTFRSVVVALTAIGLNLLSVASAYGLLTWVFQSNWAQRPLDFRTMDAVVTWLPLFLFAVLFGLSMDYHVFVVSRIREAVDRGMPTRRAVAAGITGSAGTVTSAAVVMVAVFAIFATLTTIDMKQLGVGLAAAILIDATVIRAVVLPSAMILLGEANWWAPRFLRRITYVPKHSPVAVYHRRVIPRRKSASSRRVR
jgi:RND superfamily putative drug exporter